MSIHLEDLALPFPSKDVKFRVGATTRDKKRGQALAYLDARAIQQRFDDVAGRENWKVSFRVEKPYGDTGSASVICRIELRIGADWIAKEDGCQVDPVDLTTEPALRVKQNKAIEIAIKGAYSDAEKRAAVQWGVGRYLYSCEPAWVPLSEDGAFLTPPALDDSKLPRVHELICVRNALRNAAEAAKQPGADLDDLMGEVVPSLGYFSRNEIVVGVVERCVQEILRRNAEGRRIGDVVSICRRMHRRPSSPSVTGTPQMPGGDPAIPKQEGGLYVSGDAASEIPVPGADAIPSDLAKLAVLQIGKMSHSELVVLERTVEGRFPKFADRSLVMAGISERRLALAAPSSPTQIAVLSNRPGAVSVLGSSKSAVDEEEWVQAGFARIEGAQDLATLDSYMEKLPTTYTNAASRARVAAAIDRRRRQLSRTGKRGGRNAQATVAPGV